MPEPVSTTVLVVSLVASAAATAVNVVGQRRAAKSRADAAEFNAKVAANNAKVQQSAAAADAERIRNRNRRLAARQKAAFAKSGVRIDDSVEDVIFDDAVQGELNALNREFRGQISVGREQARSQLGFSAADNARAQGNINALGAGLSGAGRIASTASQLEFE